MEFLGKPVLCLPHSDVDYTLTKILFSSFFLQSVLTVEKGDISFGLVYLIRTFALNLKWSITKMCESYIPVVEQMWCVKQQIWLSKTDRKICVVKECLWFTDFQHLFS